MIVCTNMFIGCFSDIVSSLAKEGTERRQSMDKVAGTCIETGRR